VEETDSNRKQAFGKQLLYFPQFVQ